MSTDVLDRETCDAPPIDDAELQSDESRHEGEPVKAAPEAPAEDMSRLERDHYEAIQQKERAVRGLEADFLDLKEQASRAKKDFDQADLELRNLIARGPDAQKKLPFPAEEAATEPPKVPARIRLTQDLLDFTITAGQEFDAIVDANGDVSIDNGSEGGPIDLEPEEFEVIAWVEPPPPVDPDAWRSVPVAQLGLTAKINDLLLGVGVSTMGEMEDFRARVADAKEVWPKGIGPAKLTDIENRIVDWLSANRDKFGEAA